MAMWKCKCGEENAGDILWCQGCAADRPVKKLPRGKPFQKGTDQRRNTEPPKSGGAPHKVLTPEQRMLAGTKCPACASGRLAVKTGKFGEFLACDQYPRCAYIHRTNKAVEGGEGGGRGMEAQSGDDMPGKFQGKGEGRGEGGSGEPIEGEGQGEGDTPADPFAGLKEIAEKGASTQNSTPPNPMDDHIRKLAGEEADKRDGKLVEATLAAVGGILEGVEDAVTEVSDRMTALEQKVATGEIGSAPRHIVVEHEATGEKREVHGLVHEAFAEVLELAAAGENVMLVGPSGCGKTHMAKQVAEALGRHFGTLSVSGGISETQLIGRQVPGVGGEFQYQRPEFVKCFEEGNSVFLLDELDGGDANAVLVLNQAVSNGMLPVPNRTDNPYAIRGEKYALIAAMNTYGRGADRLYVGRNQLDEATLDRFVCNVIEMDYDRALEAQLCPDKAVCKAVWGVRDAAVAGGFRRIVSTRGLMAVYRRVQRGSTIPQALVRLTTGWTADERAKCGVKVK